MNLRCIQNNLLKNEIDQKVLSEKFDEMSELIFKMKCSFEVMRVEMSSRAENFVGEEILTMNALGLAVWSSYISTPLLENKHLGDKIKDLVKFFESHAPRGFHHF